MTARYQNPVHHGYFADPFVVRDGDRWVAYGTGSVVEGLVFEVLVSQDLVSWRPSGAALEPIDPALGTTYWAPEVVAADGAWWMYYSVGVKDAGHHLRVALASSPLGPFVDQGVDLTPGERFAIDPSPFRDVDGTWYLYFARDVLDTDRVGTQLAVDVLTTMSTLSGDARSVLAPSQDWQIYQRKRPMYGAVHDWHTLEGPAVVHRNGRYYCIYSGGSWQGAGYGVGWAQAQHPLGPWTDAATGQTRLLTSVPGHVVGPGHASVTTTTGGTDILVYHAWDTEMTRRRMCIDPLLWAPDGPRTPGPSWNVALLPD